MIRKIVQTLHDEFTATLGPASSVANKIEQIAKFRLPDTVVAPTLGIVPRTKTQVNYEIGKQFASLFDYAVDLYIVVPGLDRDASMDIAETIEMRVQRYLQESTVLIGLTEEKENVREVVAKVQLINTSYPEVQPPFTETTSVIVLTVSFQVEYTKV